MEPLPESPSAETVGKLFRICEGFVGIAEGLVGEVVEIDAKLAEALVAEVSLITGDRARIEPKILTPSLLFREYDLPESSESTEPTELNRFLEKDKLFPQIPSSQLSLDFCGVLYNCLVVRSRIERARSSEAAKNKSNALYLAALRALLHDLQKLKVQRDALDHVMFAAQDSLALLLVEPRVLAAQLSLIDVSLFGHMAVQEELQYAGWIGRERRHRAPNLTAMREFGGFVSHWLAWEILKPGLSMQQRAEHVVHIVAVGECLADLASYNVLAALVRGLSCVHVLRIDPLVQLIPKRSLIAWDTLQITSQDPAKQRALLTKAPATCIPAIDTAFLINHLSCDSETLNAKSNASFAQDCETIEKFRMQSCRVYGIKHPTNPAVQHFILSRPFLSSTELSAASHLIFPETANKNSSSFGCPIKPFYRRILDDDDRLFMPLKPPSKLDIEQVPTKVEEEEETFSLGDQFDIGQVQQFHPLDDVDERAARINSNLYNNV
jgi:hypothetical protein